MIHYPAKNEELMSLYLNTLLIFEKPTFFDAISFAIYINIVPSFCWLVFLDSVSRSISTFPEENLVSSLELLINRKLYVNASVQIIHKLLLAIRQTQCVLFSHDAKRGRIVAI